MPRATSVEPVKITPAMRGSATSGAPTVSPRPGRNCSAATGTPARCKSRTASCAISGVCSAGFASTGLPAASAAATSPTKIASGKFHGEIATTGPIGSMPVGIPSAPRRVPAPRSSAGNRRPHELRRCRWRQRLARFAHRQRDERRRARLPGDRPRARDTWRDRARGVVDHARPSSPEAIATARVTSSASASITRPTMSSRAAGLRSRWQRAKRIRTQPRRSAQRHAAATRPRAPSASAASVASSARSRPREFGRPGQDGDRQRNVGVRHAAALLGFETSDRRRASRC